ncbi:MAG TPA: YihY/virulence factor BrkB family protein [Candidatus Saccharimonadales bacterium]|nr:YihY/virulence factor BrkB family protein [Candidatus Saccharimonadales bacterium]
MNIINTVQSAVKKIDTLQQRHTVLAIPFAVIKKYGEDRGNARVALLTYYGFLSLFPLLLLLVTGLELFLASYPHLREEVLHTTLSNFPALSQDLNENISALSGAWYRIILGTILTLLASFGIANTLRETINDLWQVPRVSRKGFPWNYLANLVLIALGGFVLIATTLVTGLVAKNGTPWYFVLSALINFGLFLLIYRVATSRQIKTKNLLIQSGITAIAWQTLQMAGGYLVERQLSHLNLLYGSFAVVLGLVFWLYFVARISLYAIEIDVVLTGRLWPRSLTGETTEAGRKVYTGYAKAQKRIPEENITVRFRKPKSKA